MGFKYIGCVRMEKSWEEKMSVEDNLGTAQWRRMATVRNERAFHIGQRRRIVRQIFLRRVCVCDIIVQCVNSASGSLLDRLCING